MVTRIRVIIRPRRLRSSMNLVAIIPPDGIHDPRWSLGRWRVDGDGAASWLSVTASLPGSPVGW